MLLQPSERSAGGRSTPSPDRGMAAMDPDDGLPGCEYSVTVEFARAKDLVSVPGVGVVGHVEVQKQGHHGETLPLRYAGLWTQEDRFSRVPLPS